MRTLLFVLLVLTAAHGTQVRAAQFCVNSQNTLQAALSAAQTNGQNDVIRVVAGTYALSAGLTFVSSETHSLQLSGGYDAACQTQSAAFSVLNGQGQHQPLDIENDFGDVKIDRLIFENGVAADPGVGGGGLDVSSFSGDVSIELCEISFNRSDGYAGGVRAGTSAGDMYFRNNLVLDNAAMSFGGAELFDNSGVAYVVGNTVVLNHDTQATAGGLIILGDGSFALADNILWNNNQNASPDLAAGATHTRVANDIGIASGTAPDFVSAELDVDPRFVQCGFLCFSFALADDSPLIDAGNDSPFGGLTGVDLHFNPRVMGARSDIGAFENDHIFGDGFGP